MAKSGIAQLHKPAHKISRRKAHRNLLEPEERRPHRTLDDWDRQEQAERSITRPPDDISEWVGISCYYPDYSDPIWRDDFLKDPETVTRFYPHEKLIVDLPDTQEDTLRRIDLFERLGIKYMYINVDEELDEDRFKRRLKRVRENHEKANRSLAGHGVRRAG